MPDAPAASARRQSGWGTPLPKICLHLSAFSCQKLANSSQPTANAESRTRVPSPEPRFPIPRPFPHRIRLFQEAVPLPSREEPTVKTALPEATRPHCKLYAVGCELSALLGSGQWIDAQFHHRVVFKIIGDESKLVVDGDRCDRSVGGRQGNAFAGIVTLQQARHTGNWPYNRKVLQALEQFSRPSFLMGSETGIDFCHVDRTAGQQVTLLQKFFEDLVPVMLAVQSVNNDTGIEKVGGHVSGLPLSESAFRPRGATCPPTSLLRVSIRDDLCLSRNRRQIQVP